MLNEYRMEIVTVPNKGWPTRDGQTGMLCEMPGNNMGSVLKNSLRGLIDFNETKRVDLHCFLKQVTVTYSLRASHFGRWAGVH